MIRYDTKISYFDTIRMAFYLSINPSFLNKQAKYEWLYIKTQAISSKTTNSENKTWQKVFLTTKYHLR